MPLYYYVLLTIFKDLIIRGYLPVIVGFPHLNILQVFLYGKECKLLHRLTRSKSIPYPGSHYCHFLGAADKSIL